MNDRTFFERLQKKFKPISLKDLSTEKLESQDFWKKVVGALEFFGVWGPAYSALKKERSRAGLLDLLFLGIPRFLDFLADESIEWAEGNQFLGWGMLLFGRPLLRLLFIIQQIIGLALTIAATVTFLLPIVHWLYPHVESSRSESDGKIVKGEDGKKRRQLFFNPSAGIWAFLLLMGVSFWIQLVNPALFFESVAAPLLIAQAAFVGVAGLMLVGGVIYLAYSAFAWLLGSKEENGVVTYFRELWSWAKNNPKISIPLAIFWGLCIVTALTFVIGFFVDPAAFSFIKGLFEFYGDGFGAGIKNAGHLAGLEFLSSISDAAVQLFGHIVAASAFLCAAIFGPDFFRLVLQYFSAPDEARVETSKKGEKTEPALPKQVTAGCDFDHKLWNEQNPESKNKASFSFSRGDVFQVTDMGDGWSFASSQHHLYQIPFDLTPMEPAWRPLGKYEPAIVANGSPLQPAGNPRELATGDHAAAALNQVAKTSN